ncbi:MAG: Gfo/Idh/MocA family oxidoreductase, partial [Phycisphaerae bacterium]|nr:Gfo/Idh/MocA family oxidoreductase [Phycisphaerae bacterium]
LDGVLVGTRCSLHATMAVPVLERGLPLFLEKPVATCYDDLRRLRDVGLPHKDRVVVSFPLRVSPMAQAAKEIIDSGKLGTIEHVRAWNDVPYGWHYFQWWYRNEDETGGLFLQKATHDFDCINYLLGLAPRRVCAMKTKRIFRGDMPADQPCNQCRREDCLESIDNLLRRGVMTPDKPYTRMCCFAVDTGNEDAPSALVEYETGMHMAYSQNFVVRRRPAAARGAKFIGYKGSLEFDWYTDELKVCMHHEPRVDVTTIDSSALAHAGGDARMAANFIQVIRGQAPSNTPLDTGLLSVLMCLKARDSAEKGTFEEIDCTDALGREAAA